MSPTVLTLSHLKYEGQQRPLLNKMPPNNEMGFEKLTFGNSKLFKIMLTLLFDLLYVCHFMWALYHRICNLTVFISEQYYILLYFVMVLFISVKGYVVYRGISISSNLSFFFFSSSRKWHWAANHLVLS